MLIEVEKSVLYFNCGVGDKDFGGANRGTQYWIGIWIVL
jgi:hypothetical protein